MCVSLSSYFLWAVCNLSVYIFEVFSGVIQEEGNTGVFYPPLSFSVAWSFHGVLEGRKAVEYNVLGRYYAIEDCTIQTHERDN